MLDPLASHTEHVQLSLDAFAMTDWRGRSVAYSGTYSVIFDSGGERLVQQDVVLDRDVVVDALPAPRSNRASVGVD